MGPSEGEGDGRVSEAAVREAGQITADLNVGGLLTGLHSGRGRRREGEWVEPDP